jgi:hypothetical protein
MEPRRLLSATLDGIPAVAKTTVTPGEAAGYSPAQVLHAYGFDVAASSIGAVGGDGAGQTIAIVEAYNDPTLASDLHVFDQKFGLADPPSLKLVDENGGNYVPPSNSVWSSETSLDVEWAHAVAPMANIVVVQAESAELGNLLTAVNTARQMPDVSVVSMSWGVDEFPTETKFDTVFTTPPGHQAVTFIASSGDTANSKTPQWPATSPNVVSVGGATLTISTNTTSGATQYSFAGAVSGVSLYESQPGYQQGTSTADARTTPDVVYDASPNPGFAVFNSSAGGWQTLGGTSSGAPQWAGLVAIANQVRAVTGHATLNGTTQTLPALYNYYKSNQEATIITSTSPTLTAGGLVSTDGQPQAKSVINALALARASGYSWTVLNQSIAALVASAPKRKAHPAALNLPVLTPMIHFSSPVSANHQEMQSAFAGAQSYLAGAVPLGKSGLAGGGASSTQSATSLLAMALPEMIAANVPGRDPVAQLMNSIYGEISALGTRDVVPVGATASMLLAEPRSSWFIAHVNVAATFGDAIAGFINDCALMPPPSAALAEQPPHGHLRAWVVTISVLAIDGLLIYYLVSRRRREFAFDEPVPVC